MEKTLVFLKPDAVYRGLIGRIIARFERRGFKIAGLKMTELSEDFVRTHYEAHRGKHFYEPLVRYAVSGPVVALVLEGKDAVAVVRRMMGQTFGGESRPGTIRGDMALSDRYNLIHGSDSPEAAKHEIDAFFDSDDLVSYPKEATRWIYDQTGPEPV